MLDIEGRNWLAVDERDDLLRVRRSAAPRA